MMQVQFLLFHSEAYHVDTALRARPRSHAYLMALAQDSVGPRGRRRGPIFARLWRALRLALSLAVLLFSVTIVTFPGEWQEERLPSWPILPRDDRVRENQPTTTDGAGYLRRASIRDWVANAKRFSLRDWLFNELPDTVRRRRFPFSNTLILTGLNMYEGLGIDDPDKAKWQDSSFALVGAI